MPLLTSCRFLMYYTRPGLCTFINCDCGTSLLQKRTNISWSSQGTQRCIVHSGSRENCVVLSLKTCFSFPLRNLWPTPCSAHSEGQSWASLCLHIIALQPRIHHSTDRADTHTPASYLKHHHHCTFILKRSPAAPVFHLLSFWLSLTPGLCGLFVWADKVSSPRGVGGDDVDRGRSSSQNTSQK